MAGTNLMDLVEKYRDEAKARAFLESLRWPNGAICPQCGVSGESYRIRSAVGSSTRKGVWRCRACRGQFTVTVGTVMEDSHVPLSKWVIAIHLLAASKKGHERAPAPPDARHVLQERVVHGAQNPVRDGPNV